MHRHRRAPGKQDKEAIRPKYELYNDIKLLLTNAARGDNDDHGAESSISLEKKLLQRRLRRFESSFEAREGRKVKYHKDIASVRATYQRYKNLKRILQNEWVLLTVTHLSSTFSFVPGLFNMLFPLVEIYIFENSSLLNGLQLLWQVRQQIVWRHRTAPVRGILVEKRLMLQILSHKTSISDSTRVPGFDWMCV